MRADRDGLAYVLAAMAGMGLWFWSSFASGKREPWDDSGYWTFAYPMAIGTTGALGYFFPKRPWRWPLTLFLAQFVAMAIRNGELGNLWPLGMILFAVLSLPGVALSRFSALLRGKVSTK
jgi:hypothetical protein